MPLARVVSPARGNNRQARNAPLEVEKSDHQVAAPRRPLATMLANGTHTLSQLQKIGVRGQHPAALARGLRTGERVVMQGANLVRHGELAEIVQ